MTKFPIAFAGCLSLILVVAAAPAMAKPIYPNSAVSNDLEFIATSDASAFACIRFDAGARPRCRTGARMV